MPLLDHFSKPLAGARSWEAFHADWCATIAAQLNQILPTGLLAEPNVHHGPQVEIDVAAFEDRSCDPVAPQIASSSVAFQPGQPIATLPATYPDIFEILVVQPERARQLVAAVELVSPSNKDRRPARAAFTGKCIEYLGRGVGLAIIDIVTSRRAKLHDQIVEKLAGEPGAARLPERASAWCAAYRPLRRPPPAGGEIQVWVLTIELGRPLPENLPLWIDVATAVPLDLEQTYAETCRRRRIDMDRLAAAIQS